MNETNDASAMFAPIWRRKWLILVVGILVGVGTYFYYKHQKPTYAAATQVYLGAGAEEQVLAGAGGASKRAGTLEPTAQAVLINSAIIKRPVHLELKKHENSPIARSALLGQVKAKATEKSPFITLTAEAERARGAALLANVTAQTYVTRQNGTYLSGIERAIALARRQMKRIEASQESRPPETTPAASTGKGNGAKSTTTTKPKGVSTAVALQVADLSTKINQLESSLSVVSVKQIQPAVAKEISSSPKSNAVFGFVIGLLLASFVAYALARIDNRLRSLTEIEAAFETEVLTALAAVRRPILYTGGQPRPSNLLRDSLQRLHTTLQVGTGHETEGRKARTIVFVSAHGGDGQSTVIADLALVQRSAGASVAVVEADLRRPVQSRLLGVPDRPGLADVLEGRLALGEALQGVAGEASAAPTEGQSTAVATLQAPARTGSVSVLVGGEVVNPSAALAGPAMAETVRTLAERFDYVLVDAPPPLELSDVMPLLGLVDGIVLVARVGQTRAVAARRLVQLLRRTPSAPLLGVVANGASQREIAKFGFSTYAGGSRRSGLFRR